MYFEFRLTSETGFDQFGSLFGQVTIGDGDSKEVCEMNLPGARHIRNSAMKPIAGLTRWRLVGSCKDGCVVSLMAWDIQNENE